MKRLPVIALVAAMLLLAGCADGGGTADPDRTDGTDADGNLTVPAENGSSDETSDSSGVDGELEIHHIDVGQADATLLVEPSGETMLVDSGDWRQDGAGVIEYLEARGVDRIDHLVTTHADADHIGGHAAVIEHYETERDGVGAVYDSGVTSNSQTYQRYLDAVETHDVELFVVDENDGFEFGDATVDVLNPPAGESGTDKQYNSVTLMVEFGEFSYLTTGDAEADAEERMAEEYGSALESDVYHSGHHGSSTSSTRPFMERVDPASAVISSAYDSQYGHPSDAVLEDYATRDIETYWTGVHGDIVLTTDGEDYEFETEREFSTDAGALLEEKRSGESRAALEPPIHVTPAPTAS
ncbi:ComEC/Rec2 family competence protein [Natronococcus sp. JC468]|uniref:ComEC/Rec2 family competence protein n=1 Tax=Natronococcus sp. JC468 TaxID=1961921 RepID=UPI001AE048FC|nr:MBL fold metallo-hydrolase [Natronococcus sp. JC468]